MFSTQSRIFIATAAVGVAANSFARAQCVTFDGDTSGSSWEIGEQFSYDGVGFTAAPAWSIITEGSLVTVSTCSGGTALYLSGTSVEVGMADFAPGSTGAREITFEYNSNEGNVVLEVNGLAGTFDAFASGAGYFESVGVSMSGIQEVAGRAGSVILSADRGFCIESLRIGGQSLCIDNLCATQFCMCTADIAGREGALPDGTVDVFDFLHVIQQWGLCGYAGCEADIAGAEGEPDGQVDALDMLLLVTQWGSPAQCG